MNSRRHICSAAGLCLTALLAGCAGPPLAGPDLTPLIVPAGSSPHVEWGGLTFNITGWTVAGACYDSTKAWWYPYFWWRFRFVEGDSRFELLLSGVVQHELSSAGCRLGEPAGDVVVTGEVTDAKVRAYGLMDWSWAECRFLVQWSLRAKGESEVLYTASTVGVYSMPQVKGEKFRVSVRLGFVPALRTAFRNLLADKAFVAAVLGSRSGSR